MANQATKCIHLKRCPETWHCHSTSHSQTKNREITEWHFLCGYIMMIFLEKEKGTLLHSPSLPAPMEGTVAVSAAPVGQTLCVGKSILKPYSHVTVSVNQIFMITLQYFISQNISTSLACNIQQSNKNLSAAFPMSKGLKGIQSAKAYCYTKYPNLSGILIVCKPKWS